MQTAQVIPTGKHVYRATDWRLREGDVIELRRNGTVIRRGTVDAVMYDGSGLWLAATGADHRKFLAKDDSLEVWVECSHR